MTEEEIRRDERTKIWHEMSKLIQWGVNLPGNGSDKHAERNGIVLAHNFIFDLGINED